MPFLHSTHVPICRHNGLSSAPWQDLTHNKHVCKDLLWVLHFGYLAYYTGFVVPWVYMSICWHFSHFPHFWCAPRAEVSKMVFLGLQPGPLLIKGVKSFRCLHEKAKILSPMRSGDTTAAVITFGMTNPPLDHNGPQLNLPLISALRTCAPGIQG